MGRLKAYLTISCAVNPSAGREKEYALVPALKNKKIMVVGGGVAGCEAARVLAERGYEVELFEKSGQLGGNLIPGGAPDFKADDKALVAWFIQELAALKVKIHYHVNVTAKQVRDVQADAVIIATGATPRRLNLGNNQKVYLAADILTGKEDAGDRTVIIGGGLVGCETALMLVKQGKKVTVVEAMDDILCSGAPLCHANSEMLVDLLHFYKVGICTVTKAVRATNEGLVIEKNGVEETIVADSVIVSVGYNANQTFFNEVRRVVPEAYLLGDARKVSNIMYAIWDAFEVARNL